MLGGPDSCCLLQGTKWDYVVKKHRCLNSQQSRWQQPLWLFRCRWKANSAGQHISNAWDRFVQIRPFPLRVFPVFLFAAGQTTFLYLLTFLVLFTQVCYSLSGEFDIKNWKGLVSLCFVTSYPLTNLVWNHSALLLTHRRPRRVSPISKVKPLTVSWRASMALTRLSLYATLLASLGDTHLSGSDGSVALSSCLPLCAQRSTTRCSKQLPPEQHKNTLSVRGGDAGDAFFKASRNALYGRKRGRVDVRLLQR